MSRPNHVDGISQSDNGVSIVKCAIVRSNVHKKMKWLPPSAVVA